MSKNVMELFNDWFAATEQPPATTKSTARASTSTHIRASAAPRPSVVRVAEISPAPDTPKPRPLYDRAMRARWLQQHGVRTELLDGGVGCCWFAQQGDDEDSVCGQSEEEAIARLALEKGLPWPAA